MYIFHLLKYSFKCLCQVFSVRDCAVSHPFDVVQGNGGVLCGLLDRRMWRFCGISLSLTSVPVPTSCNTRCYPESKVPIQTTGIQFT